MGEEGEGRGEEVKEEEDGGRRARGEKEMKN